MHPFAYMGGSIHSGRLIGSCLGLIGLVALLGPLSGEETEQFQLHDGDRIVFYGDSITQEGGYARLVESYVRTRFPAWDVRFYNSGVGGDKVDGGGAGIIGLRLQRDVISLHPTVVTIMLGMNDGAYQKLEPSIQDHFAQGYRSIVSRLRKELPEARLFLILPSPFDDVARTPQFDPGYDQALRQLGETVAAIARENQLPTIDFGEPLNAGIARVLRAHPELARSLLPDRVHPNPAGHLVLGAALLRAWHAPTLVSRVRINLGTKRVEVADSTVVSELNASGRQWSWQQVDRALPLPLNFQDAYVDLADQALAGLEAFDQETLQVTGLAAGTYELRIDGKLTGTFSQAELATGFNLARYNTPMRGQAFSTLWGTESSQLVQRIRRELMANMTLTGKSAVTAEALAAYDEDKQSNGSRVAAPVPRTYSLTALPP